MNKNEIASQFTKQILEEKPGFAGIQCIQMVLEIERLHAKTLKETDHYSQYLIQLSHSIQDLQNKSQRLATETDRLTKQIAGTVTIYEKKERVSIWRRYWIALLTGVIATLITNLIWQLTV